MKLSKQRIFNFPIWLALVVILLAVAGSFGYYFFQQKSSQVKTYDNFPIWLMRDGKVAVYREMTVDKGTDEIKNTLVVQNLSEENQKNVKIYEVIPKEIAQKASDLEFSIQPEIIEDDPLVLWHVGKPGRIRDPTLKETVLFLPKLGAFVVEMTAKAAVAKTSGICETKTAKEWMNERGIKNPGFFNCLDYMGHIKKEVQERQTKEWQNKMEENKVVSSIESTDKQYKDIKTKAKAKIQPTPTIVSAKSTKKITNEEAVAIIKKNFGAAEDHECEAAFNNEDKGYRVVCNRQNYWIGPAGKYGTFWEFDYRFFYVSADGKFWTSKGEYSRWQRNEGKDVQTFGKPIWGVQ